MTVTCSTEKHAVLAAIGVVQTELESKQELLLLKFPSFQSSLIYGIVTYTFFKLRVISHKADACF